MTVPEHVRSRLARLEPPGRLPGVDLARGLAIFGMFAAHLTITADLEWSRPGTWSGLVDGRPSILFATLAGVSLVLSTTPTRRPDASPGDHAEVFVAARAVLIWMIGLPLVAMTVPVHVILPTYGLLFLIGACLLRVPTGGLFALAAAIAVLAPFAVLEVERALAGTRSEALEMLLDIIGWHYPFVLWAAFLAAGMGAGRLLLRDALRHAAGLLGAGVLLALIGYGLLGELARQRPGLLVLRDEPHSSGMGEAIGSGGFALAAIGLCVLLGATGLTWLLWPLRAVGSMPLTAYTAQLLVWEVWIVVERSRSGFVDPLAGFRALEPFWPMTIGVTLGCTLWVVTVGRGPLEALVGRLSAELTKR